MSLAAVPVSTAGNENSRVRATIDQELKTLADAMFQLMDKTDCCCMGMFFHFLSCSLIFSHFLSFSFIFFHFLFLQPRLFH